MKLQNLFFSMIVTAMTGTIAIYYFSRSSPGDKNLDPTPLDISIRAHTSHNNSEPTKLHSQQLKPKQPNPQEASADTLSEESSVDKHRKLRGLMESGHLDFSTIKNILHSSEPLMLKAAYITSCDKANDFKPESKWFDLLANSYLRNVDYNSTEASTSNQRTFNYQIHNCLKHLNKNGEFNTEIIELYNATDDSNFIKSITDKEFLNEVINNDTLSETDKLNAAVATNDPNILREMSTKTADQDDGTYNSVAAKYHQRIAMLATKEEWGNLVSNQSKALRDKAYVGISMSSQPGKSTFLMREWLSNYYEPLSHMTDMPEPGDYTNIMFEVCMAYWSEAHTKYGKETEQLMRNVIGNISEVVDAKELTPGQFARLSLASQLLITCEMEKYTETCNQSLKDQSSLAYTLKTKTLPAFKNTPYRYILGSLSL